jgi:hypothetical protein
MRKRIKYFNGIPHALVRFVDHDQEVLVLDNSEKIIVKKVNKIQSDNE